MQFYIVFGRYLAVVNPLSDQIVFWYGPTPAATSEVFMARESGLVDKLPPGKRLLADGGFVGEPTKITVPFKLAQARRDLSKRRFNRKVARQRWRIESVFARLKRWRVLKEC